MKKLSKALGLLLLVFSLIFSTAISWAQSGGTLKGKVVDKDEKFSLPTVKVTVVGAKKYASTDSDGTFIIENIPPGVYKVKFELASYLDEMVKNVQIAAGETVELNISMKMGFAHEVTVTARREKVSLQKVPQNVEVLTGTELEETPINNILQALNNITGVDVATGSGNTTLGTFMSIDGYDDVYIRKMVDGVDIGEVVANWSMLNAYPQEMIDQVEVIKGGSSSVWGSNMGGIINVITKRPSDMERPMISFKTTFAKFGEMEFGDASAYPNSGYLQRYSADIVGTHQDLYYMLGYKREIHDGFVDYGAEKNYNIFAKFGYNLSDTTYLDFLYNVNKVGYQSHSFLKIDWFGPLFPYYWHYKRDGEGKTQVASLKFSTYVVPEFNIEAQLKFNRMNYSSTTEGLEGSLIPPYQGEIQTATFVDQKIGLTLKGSYRPNENFSLISGIDYYRIKADFTDFIADQPIIFVDNFAPFINLEYRIGQLGLHAGARYDYDSSFGSQLSPSLGANFNFLKNSLIRFNIARTFRVPPLWYTLGESYVDMILPNPDLKPERAWAYSIGFESQELKYVWVKVSLYYHRMTDGIVRVPADTPGRYTWGNATKFIRKGYEAEIGIMTGFGLTGYIGTNYNDHKDETAAETLTWIPTRTYKSGLKYKNEKLDLLINLRGRWIWWNEDEFLMELFNPQDKKWLFDLKVSKGFNISENISLVLFFDIFNLTNQIYWDRSDMPNPRRWADFGIELRLK